MNFSILFRQTANQAQQAQQAQQALSIANTSQSSDKIFTICVNSTHTYTHEASRPTGPRTKLGINVASFLSKFKKDTYRISTIEIPTGRAATINVETGSTLMYREIKAQDRAVIELLSVRNLNPHYYVIVKSKDLTTQQIVYCLLKKVDLAQYPEDIFTLNNGISHLI